MITEAVNKRKKQFVYIVDGHVDSEQFRRECFREFSIELFVINHVHSDQRPQTIGYSRPIYDLFRR
jgi:hypothetical protein